MATDYEFIEPEMCALHSAGWLVGWLVATKRADNNSIVAQVLARNDTILRLNWLAKARKRKRESIALHAAVFASRFHVHVQFQFHWQAEIHCISLFLGKGRAKISSSLDSLSFV